MKLYIIVQKALSSGLKAAQACHALYSFTLAYPQKTLEWAESNNIVILEHEDMAGLADTLEAMGLALVRFHEPDLDDRLTAICVEPSARRHVAALRLAS